MPGAGRTLRAPPGDATRPTADRLRQAVFDMLLHAPWGGRLDGMRCWTRSPAPARWGWKRCPAGRRMRRFMERDRAALDALRSNAAPCRDVATVLAADVLQPPPGQPCGLVFLDPPYGAGLLPGALAALRRAGWIAGGALLVAESARGDRPGLGETLAERGHGAGMVTIWRDTATIEREA